MYEYWFSMKQMCPVCWLHQHTLSHINTLHVHRCHVISMAEQLPTSAPSLCCRLLKTGGLAGMVKTWQVQRRVDCTIGWVSLNLDQSWLHVSLNMDQSFELYFHIKLHSPLSFSFSFISHAAESSGFRPQQDTIPSQSSNWFLSCALKRNTLSKYRKMLDVRFQVRIRRWKVATAVMWGRLFIAGLAHLLFFHIFGMIIIPIHWLSSFLRGIGFNMVQPDPLFKEFSMNIIQLFS